MDGKHSLSATNLSVYQHLNCNLYIHNVYNGSSQGTPDTTSSPSELTKAQCQRGLDWETSLYSWLGRSHLLLKVPSIPLEASSLLENIQADDRNHFFITGLSFWPPQARLAEMFAHTQTEPFNFGLAKPDLLEIKRTNDGVITWRVLDAKASKHVKVWPYFFVQRTAFSSENVFLDFTPYPNLLLHVVLKLFARRSLLPRC